MGLWQTRHERAGSRLAGDRRAGPRRAYRCQVLTARAGLWRPRHHWAMLRRAPPIERVIFLRPSAERAAFPSFRAYLREKRLETARSAADDDSCAWKRPARRPPREPLLGNDPLDGWRPLLLLEIDPLGSLPRRPAMSDSLPALRSGSQCPLMGSPGSTSPTISTPGLTRADLASERRPDLASDFRSGVVRSISSTNDAPESSGRPRQRLSPRACQRTPPRPPPTATGINRRASQERRRLSTSPLPLWGR